jgi:DNA-binding transcriptional LysR family regulator
MSMRRYDLNLLPILDSLLRQRNLTRAGKELGLSQSAMSHALVRLRTQFKDRLLIPSGREMLLSHRAEAMAPALSEILGLCEHLLDTRSFDPATASRRFKIGTADYVALLFLPLFLARLKETPGITLQVTWDRQEKPAKLRSNQLDLAIVPRGTFEDTDLHSETLLVDDLVVVTCLHNPEVGGTLDRETFLRLPHARMRLENTVVQNFSDIQLANNQIEPRDVVLVSNFLLLPFILRGTNLISLISRRVAEKLRESAEIKMFEPPFPTAKLYLDAYWSHRVHSDPGHQWLRSVLREVCAAI